MRCPEHDLALGPDGQCVVCRRAAAASRPPAPSAAPWILGTLAAMACITAAGVGARALMAAAPVALARKAPLAMPTPVIEPTATSLVGSGQRPLEAATQAVDPNAWRASMPSVRIVVYTTSWCPVCKDAKRWLGANGYAYDERDIEASQVNRIECKALNPRVSIPTFDVEGQVMVGFSSGQLVAMVEQAARKRAARAAR